LNKTLNRKKAFTFAELMISLVVIAVITLILYPTISDLAPNNNKYLFKETYQTITMIVSDYINDVDKSAVDITSDAALCNIFCSKLNTASIKNSALVDTTCSSCRTFTTSNGMRWAFRRDGDNGYILIDVNASNNRVTNGTFPEIKNNRNQIIYASGNSNPWTNTNSATGLFYTDDTITCDTFLFEITPNGQVSPQGAVAAAHVENPD